MTDILKKYLEKLGLKDYSELTTAEKEVYKQWEEVLARDVRIEDVAEFLERQVKQLSRDLREAIKEGEDRQAILLTAKIENYETIILFIREPTEAKKRLEKELLENLT